MCLNASSLQVCPRPEVVEVWDVTAQDPKLLVYLKVKCLQLSQVFWTTALHRLCWGIVCCCSHACHFLHLDLSMPW